MYYNDVTKQNVQQWQICDDLDYDLYYIITEYNFCAHTNYDIHICGYPMIMPSL